MQNKQAQQTTTNDGPTINVDLDISMESSSLVSRKVFNVYKSRQK